MCTATIYQTPFDKSCTKVAEPVLLEIIVQEVNFWGKKKENQTYVLVLILYSLYLLLRLQYSKFVLVNKDWYDTYAAALQVRILLGVLCNTHHSLDDKVRILF